MFSQGCRETIYDPSFHPTRTTNIKKYTFQSMILIAINFLMNKTR